MEAWRENLYRRRVLVHHGIKGQEWGKRNGPPYPLDADAYSAKERKIGEKEIGEFIKRYGTAEDYETWLEKKNGEKEKEKKEKKGSSGGGSSKKESKKEEKKESEIEKWETPLYSYLTKLMTKNEWTIDDLIKNVISAHGKDEKGKDYDEFLVALSDSGVVTGDEWKKLSQNAKELGRMRSKALEYFEKIKTQQKDVSEMRKKESESEDKEETKESKEDEKEESSDDKDEEDEEEKKKKNTLQHSGKGHDDNPPGRGSGRYPWGSGKKWEIKSKAKRAVEGSSFYKAKHMSDSDLKSSLKRLRDEAEYVRLSGANITDGRNFVEAMLVRAGTKTVTTFVDTLAVKTGAAGAVKLFNEMKNASLPKEKEKSK